MSTRYIESVADDAAFDNLCPTTPTKAGIAFQEDTSALALKSPAGVKKEIPLAALETAVAAVAAGYKVARGQLTTTAATDTVVTGLTTVVSVVASLDDDPVDGVMHVSATIGDQAGAPAAGSVIIKGWKSTDADATLIAATTFSKKVNWIAIGT